MSESSSPVLRDVSHDVGGLRVVGRIPQFSQLLSEPGEVSLQHRLEWKILEMFLKNTVTL